jgi:hypothetical protein
MKGKSLLFIVLFISPLLISGVGSTILLSEHISEVNGASDGSKDVVGIIVDASVWENSTVQNAVNLYKKDLSYTGYSVLLHTASISTKGQLRSLLQDWYQNNNLTGAVLVGDLPHAYFYHSDEGGFHEENFASDLYFMDLDGDWYDTDADTYFDVHNATGSADIFPEIFVARIDPSNRSYGSQSSAGDLIIYFERLHQYRLGQITRSKSALFYVDDDWRLWADGTHDNWTGWFDNSYSNLTAVHTPTSSTTANNWMTRITHDYQWGHLCAHSNTGLHHFYIDGESGGYVFNHDVNSIRPCFNFYNLFCCKAAEPRALDNIATTYLFSSDYSITVIGSTKSGGMLDGNYFYDPLGDGKSIGISLCEWFQGIQSYTSGYVQWFYGMTILGDPFLGINYDPSVLLLGLIQDAGSPLIISFVGAFAVFAFIAVIQVRRKRN